MSNDAGRLAAELDGKFAASRHRIKTPSLTFPQRSLEMIAPSDKLNSRVKSLIWSRYSDNLFISHQSDDQHCIRTTLIEPIKEDVGVYEFFYNK